MGDFLFSRLEISPDSVFHAPGFGAIFLHGRQVGERNGFSDWRNGAVFACLGSSAVRWPRLSFWWVLENATQVTSGVTL